jgi:hypothetical protein
MRTRSSWLVGGPVVLCVLGSVACSSDTEPAQSFPFTDAKGRQCTQLKYSLTADCKAEPSPQQACTRPNHACFIVYAGAVTTGESNLAGGGPKALWNCDACCADVGTAWTGVSSDCSKYTCKTDDDCIAEGGTCNAGQCQVQ